MKKISNGPNFTFNPLDISYIRFIGFVLLTFRPSCLELQKQV